MKYERPAHRPFCSRFLKNAVYQVVSVDDYAVNLVNTRLPTEFVSSRSAFAGISDDELLNVQNRWIWTDGDWYSPQAFPEIFDINFLNEKLEKQINEFKNARIKK